MSIQASRIMSGVVRPVIMTWTASMDFVRAKLCSLTVETLEEPRVFFLLFSMVIPMNHVLLLVVMTDVLGVQKLQTMTLTKNGAFVKMMGTVYCWLLPMNLDIPLA